MDSSERALQANRIFFQISELFFELSWLKSKNKCDKRNSPIFPLPTDG